jgi:hypothetical protein
LLPIRLVAPRAELPGNTGEVFLGRILEHHFARLEKTKNVVTYVHRHTTFGESREDEKVTTVRYEAVNAMLLNEFLKEHRTVEKLKQLSQSSRR